MSPLKRKSSNVSEKAEKRVAGVRSFDPNLDLGNGLNMGIYNEKIARVDKLKNDYNTAVTSANSLRIELEAAEDDLENYNTRFLAGVVAKYGKDSMQYQAAGGKRTSEIIYPSRATGKSTKSSKPDSEGTN